MPHYYKNIEGWSAFVPFYAEIADKATNDQILVEVGCWKGRSAVFLAESLKELGKKPKFYVVDSFDGGESLKGHMVNQNLTEDVLLNTFTGNLEAADVVDQVTGIIKSLSWAAADQFEDNSVDFVFIDADHGYESIKKDLAAWWPKIKPGGTFAGHDYGSWPGVTKAVDEFIAANNLDFRFHIECWVTRKPDQA